MRLKQQNKRLSTTSTSPLHSACLEGDVRTVSEMLQAGSDLDARDGIFGATPLMVRVRACAAFLSPLDASWPSLCTKRRSARDEAVAPLSNLF